MGDISKHFNRSEMSCNCGCGFDTVDVETLMVLEQVREHFNQPVTVTSGCRCEDYNYKVGGSKNSQHAKGRAADIQVKNTDPADVYDFVDLLYPDQYGFGKYDSFTHIDTRTIKARW